MLFCNRRYWVLETVPGLFVEHDDDTVGPCLERPTEHNPNSGPMDEESAKKKVRTLKPVIRKKWRLIIIIV